MTGRSCYRFDTEGDCLDCGKPKHKGGPCHAYDDFHMKETA